MIDRARLDQMLSKLEGYLDVLRVLGSVPREEFLANPDKVGNAKYHFVVAIDGASLVSTRRAKALAPSVSASSLKS
jgi:hypothetical protein